MNKKIAIIGAGISGLSAAAYAARAGHEVHVFEKHAQAGGRAREFRTTNGFAFDMGPSWYWMPDIIEDFFRDFGHSSSDFYSLVPLDPQFEMVFAGEKIAVPSSYDQLKALFEQIEAGAGGKLDAFMASAKYKYEVGMKEFVEKPCHSWTEFISPKIARSAIRLDLLSNFRSYVQRYFSDHRLRALMEFPVIFLGASPKEIPALYSIMNYGGYVLGTWYPMGGFHRLVAGMQQIAERQGAVFHFGQDVEKILATNDRATGLLANGVRLEFDAIIASSDYHHTETLLDRELRNYSERYWSSRTFAPSCLIYYLGITEKIPGLGHHTLFFENDLDRHVDAIYRTKTWPTEPLFYACCPSKTDASVAPEGQENLFLLMPLAIGLQDSEDQRELYLHQMLSRLERHTGTQRLAEKLAYKKSYCISDFINDYNAYGGNAYGLANTLGQTAVLKPSVRNRRLDNLFYAGQLTVPGPGVPPAIISGRIAARELNTIKNKKYEKAI
ncbi:phytoene desaturase family protein [Pedobacter sp. ASV12]|uniref:phytoene desaturase family protein n=1 Tax=Pedobacter sp. ASV12 TaxID=2795120 RepID=UPI0018EBA136|nr:phytoene desaturase family protein [Pedobacter sp. ASV12]